MPGLLDSPYLDPRAMAGRGLPNSQSSPRAMTAAASFVPGVGDAIGLLADTSDYIKNPKSLTLTSGLLSLAGMVPGIPRPKSLKGIWRAYNADESRTTAQDLLRFVRQMDDQPEDLMQAANRYERALKTDMEWAGRWDVRPEEEAFIDAFGLAAQGVNKAKKAKGASMFRQIVEADLRRAIERGNTGRAQVLQEQLAEMNRLGEL